MRKLLIVLGASLALTAWTTAERTATGAGVGAVGGGAVSGTAGGVVAGAVIGVIGTYLFERADGLCQYRNPSGNIITRRCHWK